jgi:hypothetical protein
MARSRSHYGPETLGDYANQLDGTRHYDYAVTIRRLTLFQTAHFRYRIKLRSNSANNLNCADAMSDGDHLLLVNVSLSRPDAPLSVHRTSGINQYTIKIEENGSTAKSGHSFF